MKQNLSYIFWPALAGILAALLIVDRWWPAQNSVIHAAPQTNSYAQAVSRAAPSVVNIFTLTRIEKPRNQTLKELLVGRAQRAQAPEFEKSLGSGVIMTREGHILTNNHVIAGADRILIQLQDGRTASAAVIDTDPDTDLAMLKTAIPDLQPIAFADSDKARVGDVVLAIGNPLGFGHSVTQGIVSALGRYGLQLARYEEYIQTDAQIHVGNSGGALINTQGELLGINTLTYINDDGGRTNASAGTSIGISMAIPVNLAAHVMRDLIAYGKVIRGWLGLHASAGYYTTASGKELPGLRIKDVELRSPADKAGLRPGDIITHLDGEPILDERAAGNHIARLRPGEAVSIAVTRGTQNIEVEAILGVQPQGTSGPSGR